jgi:hypothetical protein
MRSITQRLFAIAVAALLPAGAALAHEDAAVPNAWAPALGNSQLALGPAPEIASPHKTPQHQRRADKCDTIQGELYLKCRT